MRVLNAVLFALTYGLGWWLLSGSISCDADMGVRTCDAGVRDAGVRDAGVRVRKAYVRRAKGYRTRGLDI